LQKEVKNNMEIKNIKIPELGKKTFTVLTSNKNIRKMNQFQLEMAKIADKQSEDDMTTVMAANIEAIEATLVYLQEVLGLTDEQVEILDNLEMQRTQEIANYLSARLMGLSDKQIKEIEASSESDPKE
jgi:hypothetical protein